MTALVSPRSRWILGIAAVLTVVAGWWIYLHQNNGAEGGAISVPKAIWLSYAIFSWFILSPTLGMDARVPPAYRRVFGWFAAAMWLRGVAEIILLFVAHAWRPPMGIAHDLICVALLAVTLAQALKAGPQASRWYFALGVALLLSVLSEALFGWLFFEAVQGHTTGHAGIWFASADDPRFVTINRLTVALESPLIAATLAFLGRGWGGLSGHEEA